MKIVVHYRRPAHSAAPTTENSYRPDGKPATVLEYIASGDLQTDDKAHRQGTNRPVPAPATRGMIAGNTLALFLAGRGGGVA